MEYALEWVNLLLRWAHVIVGIAWIGASFYFIWLDNHLAPIKGEKSEDSKLAGELWAVHGGGFYRVEKFRLAPAQLPATLHWFKWEAYWTFLTGFALLCVMYYAKAELYLIDPQVMPLSKWGATGIALGFLVGGMVVYEGLCRSPLGRNENVLSAVLFVALCIAAWGLTQVFSGRGAFIHYGALIGTIMVANVAHVIIPGQRRMVKAMSEGREPDPRDGWMGKQRSVHNTYFTLPAVFAMLSNHYAGTYGHRYAWLILIALTLAGAAIRVWFVMRHKGAAPLWVLALGVVFVVAAALIALPRQTGSAISMEDAQKIVNARCVSCHMEKPTFQGLSEAPKGVRLDSTERIRAQAALIRQQVVTRAMPPGNLTGMSEEERAALARIQ
ncbi:MAG: urate hydroxylase PuuD [Betaproteobacteria bacterium]